MQLAARALPAFATPGSALSDFATTPIPAGFFLRCMRGGAAAAEPAMQPIPFGEPLSCTREGATTGAALPAATDGAAHGDSAGGAQSALGALAALAGLIEGKGEAELHAALQQAEQQLVTEHAAAAQSCGPAASAAGATRACEGEEGSGTPLEAALGAHAGALALTPLSECVSGGMLTPLAGAEGAGEEAGAFYTCLPERQRPEAGALVEVEIEQAALEGGAVEEGPASSPAGGSSSGGAAEGSFPAAGGPAGSGAADTPVSQGEEQPAAAFYTCCPKLSQPEAEGEDVEASMDVDAVAHGAVAAVAATLAAAAAADLSAAEVAGSGAEGGEQEEGQIAAQEEGAASAEEALPGAEEGEVSAPPSAPAAVEAAASPGALAAVRQLHFDDLDDDMDL